MRSAASWSRRPSTTSRAAGRRTAPPGYRPSASWPRAASTTFIINYQAADADLDAFAQLHVDWDVPTLGNVSTDLPAGNADAEDNIEPEQD